MINWDSILTSPKRVRLITEFVNGGASATKVEKNLRFTQGASEFRKLVRPRGVADARQVARKALRRRSLI